MSNLKLRGLNILGLSCNALHGSISMGPGSSLGERWQVFAIVVLTMAVDHAQVATAFQGQRLHSTPQPALSRKDCSPLPCPVQALRYDTLLPIAAIAAFCPNTWQPAYCCFPRLGIKIGSLSPWSLSAVTTSLQRRSHCTIPFCAWQQCHALIVRLLCH